MTNTILLDIGLIILFASLLANLAKVAKQPLILGYVLAGILIGPSAFGIVKNLDLIKILSELGIAFLLFIVGLELDLKKLKEVGKFATITGTIQVLLVTLLTLAVVRIWLNSVEALYVGLIVAFSSTMVVIKLISDSDELDTLHGRIILGILIIQDVLAILVLPLLSGTDSFSFSFVLLALAKALLLLAIAYLLGKTLIKSLIKSSAKNHELLFITSVSICFLFAGIGYLFGFSIAIGAFLGGVVIGNSHYSLEITGRVKALRDFFAVIFFVTLGSQIQFATLLKSLHLLFILLFLVIILKPLIFFIILKFFRHSNRTAFISSLSLAQISEFSLVLALEGFLLGTISQETFNLIIVLAIVTITLTSYFIKYHKGLFSRMENFLQPLDKFVSTKDLQFLPKNVENHIVVFGVHRMGSKIIKTLKEQHKKIVAVDFNPETIKALIKEQIPCLYGDYGTIDVLHAARIGKAKMIISTIPNFQGNLLLLKIAKGVNKNILVFVTARNAHDALELYTHGADFVAIPEFLAGQKICDYVTHLAPKEIRKWGQKYYQELEDNKKHDSLLY